MVGVVCFSLIRVILLAWAIFRSNTDAVLLESIILVVERSGEEVLLVLRRVARRTGNTYVEFFNFFAFRFSQYVKKWEGLI